MKIGILNPTVQKERGGVKMAGEGSAGEGNAGEGNAGTGNAGTSTGDGVEGVAG